MRRSLNLSKAMSSQILKGREDVFRGITIHSDKIKVSKEDAPEVLKNSLEEWKIKKVHGVWFKVFNSDSFWITLLIENGFDFHHAQNGYAMLTKWIPTDKISTLPKYPFTSIGVGGVVCNAAGQFLLIKEKRGFYMGWKFPGGLADPSEEVYDTAKREVLEETGIETEFVTVLTMRHSTSVKIYKNAGDMYFVCAMKPKNEENIVVKPCPRETSACQWMTKEEIDNLTDADFHPFNRSIIDAYFHWKESGRKGFYMEKFTIPEFNRTFSVYTAD
jgi:8-oxo-dGTP pyrophosphatase MutT (NUDIX family)|uniref:Nudix hydrolase domain-containing protein n=1 Tax=Panagrolaimus sp. PS1159 TaxID=55785 RepID=A0AC35G7H6_9BILA